MKSLVRIAIATALCLLVLPLTASADNPWYVINAANPTQYPAHITIYSLGKVRIEGSGRAKAGGSWGHESLAFTLGSWHHVRYEFMDPKTGRVLCDTSAQIYLKRPVWPSIAAGRTSGYYVGGSHCHIKDLGPG